MGINLMDAIIEKVSINESKYPIEKSKGNSKKYDNYFNVAQNPGL
jgi:hypothetical protein